MENTNQSALNFNRNVASIIQQISQPLLNFGITIFTYCRLLQDGRRLYLSSNLEWTEIYITKELYNILDHLEMYSPPNHTRYSLWSSFNRDQVFDTLYNVNIWNGFSLYEKSSDYTDSFDFASCKENNQIVNFYINNISMLEDFVKVFKNKAVDIIDSSDEKKFILPSQRVYLHKIEHSSFIKEEKIKNFIKQLER